MLLPLQGALFGFNQKSKMTLMTNDLNDTLTNPCILRWRQTMGIIFTCSSFVCSFHRMHRPHRIDSLCSVAEVKYGCRLWRRKALVLYLLCLYTDQQAFISVDSCLAKRRPFCGFEKFYARRLLLSMLKSKCFDHYFHFKLRFYILGYKAGGF